MTQLPIIRDRSVEEALGNAGLCLAYSLPEEAAFHFQEAARLARDEGRPEIEIECYLSNANDLSALVQAVK